MDTHRKTCNVRLQPIVLAVQLALVGPAWADLPSNELPTGGQVSSGQAAIAQPKAGQMDIHQATPKAVLDWHTFNIGSQAQVNFQQPDASSVALNRVASGNASVIEGKLTANGQVFLLNPSGVLFGKGAQVDVGGLTATTMNISNKDFQDGNYHFTRDGSVGEVVNQGEIKAKDGGYVALIGATVRNEGTVRSNGGGTVALAAGDGAKLQFGDGRLVNVQVDPATVKTLVENKQLIQAEGGRVLMTAVAASRLQGAVVNNAGEVEANSMNSEGGVIRLTGADEINNTGTLDASGKSAGGTVEIAASSALASAPTGGGSSSIKHSGTIKADSTEGKGGTVILAADNLQFDNGSLTSATGKTGGGEIYAGGGKQGASLTLSDTSSPVIGEGSVVLANAKSLTVASGAALDASAKDNGNGGTIVAWSTGDTRFAGTAKAEGGPNGGDGGYVETSGHQLNIDSKAKVSTRAPKGKTGEWLLDPDDFIIASSGGNETGANLSGQLNLNNITIQTTAGGTGGNGDIFVNDTVAWSSGYSLTLSAYRNINVNQAISNAGTGGVNLRADNTGGCVAGALTCGTVNFGGLGHATVNGGQVNIYYNPDDSHNKTPDPNTGVIAGAYTTPVDYTSKVTLHGGSALSAYMLVNDVYQLQSMNNNLTGTYALGKNIDASATQGWNSTSQGYEGFSPVGPGTPFTPEATASNSFTGNFDGLGHTISGLYINRADPTYIGTPIGLFGVLGLKAGTQNYVRNVGLVGATISGYGADPDPNATIVVGVGALAGWVQANAVISNVYNIKDLVYKVPNVPQNVGSVTGGGGDNVGGLVGRNSGNISQSYSTVDVTGYRFVGGLVGLNNQNISQSYSTGAVNGTDFVGGLAGQSTSNINTSYSTGQVTGNDYVGGLVGLINGVQNKLSKSVENSYSMGSVSGSNFVGGLVGSIGYPFLSGIPFIEGGGNISKSYATGAVRCVSSCIDPNWINPTVGGLVGAIQNYYYNIVDQSVWDTSTAGPSIAVPPVPPVLPVASGIGGDIAPNSNPPYSIPPVMPKGLTTTEMMSVSSYNTSPMAWNITKNPSQYQNNIWGIIEGTSYPFLTWRFPTGPQVVSGFLANPSNSQQTIQAARDGAFLDHFPATFRDQQQASVGSNQVGQGGFYYFALNNGSIASGDTLLTYLNAAATPAGAVRLSNGDHLRNMDLTAGTLTASSSVIAGSPISQTLANSDMAKAVGSLSNSATISGLPYTDSGANITVANGVNFITAGSGSSNPITNFLLGGNLATTAANQTWNSLITLTDNSILTADAGSISFAKNVVSDTNSVTGGLYDLGIKTSNFTGNGLSFSLNNLSLDTSSFQALNSTFNLVGLELLGLSTSYTFDNAGNSISNLAGNTRSVYLIDNHSLNVGSVGSSTGLTASGKVVLQTTDIGLANPTDIILSSGITSTAPNDPALKASVVLAASGNFINNVGSTGIILSQPGSRWLVYSQDPAKDIFGSLNSNNIPIWGASYALNPPASIFLPGNYYLFSIQPKIQFDSTNYSKSYGVDVSNVPTFTNSFAPVNTPTTPAYNLGMANVFNSDPNAYSINPGSKVVSSTGAVSAANVGGYQMLVNDEAFTMGTPVIGVGYNQVASLSSGILSVLPAHLTVTANPATKVYDGLAYTGGNGVTYSGFANNENSSVLGGSLIYTGTSQGAINAGSYAIVPAGYTSGNYAIGYADGSLTVNQVPLTVTANPATKVYDGLAYAGGNGVTYSGFANNENPSVLGGSLIYTGTSQGAINAGSYAIVPAGYTSGNYNIGYADGPLTINPATLLLIAQSDSKTYDGTTVSSKTPTTSGLVNGNNVLNLAQSFDSSLVGSRILNVDPRYVVNDSNGGQNYLVNTVSAPGAILPIQPSPKPTPGPGPKPSPRVDLGLVEEVEPKFGLRYNILASGNHTLTGDLAEIPTHDYTFTIQNSGVNAGEELPPAISVESPAGSGQFLPLAPASAQGVKDQVLTVTASRTVSPSAVQAFRRAHWLRHFNN